MFFEIKMAWRFLKSGKTQTFLILLGIVIGVAVQTFLGSLIGGLQQDLVDQTVGTSPHITLLGKNQQPRPVIIEDGDMSRVITYSGTEGGIDRWWEVVEKINKNENLTAVSPTINGSGFAVRGDKNIPVNLRGV